MTTTLIHNAVIVNRGTSRPGAVLIDGGRIADVIFEGPLPSASRAIDARGAYLLPGAIDTHVHLREPGLTDKGDIATETRAAVAGGVTSVIDMPNTVPPTVSLQAWQEKMEIAALKSVANYAFFIGVSTDNLHTLLHADYTRIPGIKLFLGSTTGDMMVTDGSLIERLLEEAPCPIVVHAESEPAIREALARLNPDGADDLPVEFHSRIRSARACMESSSRIVRLALDHGALLHLAHVSTADELALLGKGSPLVKRITAETCPQYLLLSTDDYTRLGTRMKCNPAVKSAADREALRRAVEDGLIDSIATDHAPHLLSDKEGGALKAKSGMPMVQFSLVKMMDLFPPETVAEKMAHNPARIFGVTRRGFIDTGMAADLVLVSTLDDPHTITDSEVVSKCGWTPLAGMTTSHRVELTMVNGHIAFSRSGEKEPPSAQPLEFSPIRR